MLTSLTRKQIADAYAKAPVFSASAVPAWMALASHSHELANKVRRRVRVMEVSDPEPYKDATAMTRAIDDGILAVSVANSDHPIWSIADNVAFRIVHDYFGHYAARSDFSWEGELQACEAHASVTSWEAFPALFTECIGQVAFQTEHGYFGTQKVALLDVF